MPSFTFGQEFVCAQCGKKIWVVNPKEYIYKRQNKWLCGYNCMRQYDREHANNTSDKHCVQTTKTKTKVRNKELRYYLAQRHITHAALAEHLGLTTKYISDMFYRPMSDKNEARIRAAADEICAERLKNFGRK